MGKDRFDKLEEILGEFVNRCDELGFDVYGGSGEGTLQIEVVPREIQEQCPCMKEPSYNCGMKCSRCGREL